MELVLVQCPLIAKSRWDLCDAPPYLIAPCSDVSESVKFGPMSPVRGRSVARPGPTRCRSAGTPQNRAHPSELSFPPTCQSYPFFFHDPNTLVSMRPPSLSVADPKP